MRQVNEKDGAEHDDNDANCADAKESASENGKASSKLSQADEIAEDRGCVHVSRKVHRSWAA
jgi:hypothetical protein